MMKHPLQILSFLTLFLTAGFLLFIFYNLIWPFKIIDVKNPRNLPVDKHEVSVGDVITYKYDYCKYRDIQSIVLKELVGKEIIILISTSSGTPRFPTGCHQTNIANIIPPQTPPGIYSIYISASYNVTPIRTVNYLFETEPFKVK